MKLLIDADICLYKAASSVEREIEFEEEIWVLYTDENEAIQAFDDLIADLLERANTDSYLLAFSDSKNFRKELFGEYKANRTQRKPLGFKSIRERVFDKYNDHISVMKTLEADDVIGILATRDKGETMIWSSDKDLRQIPGLHLTDDGQKVIYPDEADRWFYMQILTGDTADNYKGCPGIGPVKAEKILNSINFFDNYEVGASGPCTYWEAIVDTYAKAGLTEEDALLQARLARILRCNDWDSTNEKVNLWQPTTV